MTDEGTETVVTTRHGSHLVMSVQGDLNPDELADIQTTLDRAMTIADFVSGDVEGAFQGATALEVDGEQLARVRLRMRAHERLTYAPPTTLAASAGALPLPSVAEPDADQVRSQPIEVPTEGEMRIDPVEFEPMDPVDEPDEVMRIDPVELTAPDPDHTPAPDPARSHPLAVIG